jgi:putative endonuclease
MSTQKNIEVGKAGEEMAIAHLRKHGYKIIHCNWRFKKNEIDIIAMQNTTTVFVEVKARTTDFKGNPEQFVTPAKQAEIKKVAREYILDNEVDKIRFDVIAITYWPDADTELIHFEDAFF